jgi:ribosomal protein S12 methylthiotransferase
VDGAAANALPDPLPDAEREARRARLMAVQHDISKCRLARKVGTLQKVLVDAITDSGALARSTADAPEIDGVVHVAADPRLRVGEFFQVRITASDVHDLQGVLA